MARSRSIRNYSLIAILVLLLLWVFSTYNRIIAADENMNTAWRQVETQYQRRIDLIPNLVRTVQGAADFEQETLTAVTQARTQWLSAEGREEQVAAAQNTESALARLLVTVESYPTLTATQSFENLMVENAGTENRIATARRDYNMEVREYNLIVRRFPGNIFAALFGYEEATGFEAAPGSEDAPEIDFSESSS